MNGSDKSGFSLIELLIVISIVGILAGVGLPRLASLLPDKDRNEFISRLNAISQNALTGAVSTGKPHRVLVDLQKRTFLLERLTGKKDPKGQPAYENAMPPYSSKYSWPENTFDIQQFFIENKDEIKSGVGQGAKEKVWFFVVPEGMAQPVIINFLDKTIKGSERDQQVSVVLNPFSVQFQFYDHFMSPA